MLARIPVVLSQAPAASAVARQLEEDLIAELMFEQGVDVSVVPHLAQLRDGTTGLICLQGIKGDFVVLTWLEPAAARQWLLQRGISGRDWLSQKRCSLEVPRSASAQPARIAERRWHIVQLVADATADQYVREIRRLRTATEPEPRNPLALPVLDRSPEPEATDTRSRSAMEPPSILPAESDELDHLLDQLDALDL